MTTNTVIRDSSGKTINIGEWDYMKEEIPNYDDDGNVSSVTEVIYNPLPEGATSSEEDVQQTDDGGWIPTKDVTASSEDTSTTSSNSTT